MKKLLVVLIAAALGVAQSSAFAQEKKSEPAQKELTQEESKKAAYAKDSEKKSDAAEVKKDGKKKIKKGGC
ncbi:MAG: hypothetical protein ABJA83_14060 [Burkholderiaceae bacterium]